MSVAQCRVMWAAVVGAMVASSWAASLQHHSEASLRHVVPRSVFPQSLQPITNNGLAFLEGGENVTVSNGKNPNKSAVLSSKSTAATGGRRLQPSPANDNLSHLPSSGDSSFPNIPKRFEFLKKKSLGSLFSKLLSSKSKFKMNEILTVPSNKKFFESPTKPSSSKSARPSSSKSARPSSSTSARPSSSKSARPSSSKSARPSFSKSARPSAAPNQTTTTSTRRYLSFLKLRPNRIHPTTPKPKPASPNRTSVPPHFQPPDLSKIKLPDIPIIKLPLIPNPSALSEFFHNMFKNIRLTRESKHVSR